MAAGSTEAAFSSSNPSLPCFNSTLLKSDTNKYWNGAQIMATASTDSFWEDDPEEKIKKKVLASKTKFHTGRQLQIKHLPRDVTEDEIRELLCDFPVQCVHIMNSGTGSSMARALIEDPEMLEDWDKDRVFLLRGQCVPVAPTQTEMMLCIARLPFTYTEDQFTALVRSYGEIRYHFLMISEKTGESKGYGFVEYTTKECALQAKNLLDKKEIDGWTLVCDWVDSCHVTFESLHSKCLYVDCLPKDFRDMSEFRKIFSTIVNPPYCQIALKNGCPQDWGLVEYSNWEDAEAAQTSLNGYCLRGQKIRISYYIPGVRAINLYLKLLNDPGPKVKSAGLLPDPSGQVIIQSLQNLFKQNPIFAQNLQNIILGQIQASQNGETVEGQKKILPGQSTANGPNLPKNGHGPSGKMFRNSSIPDGRKPVPQATTPGQPPTKNGLHITHPPPTPGPSPTQFLKPVPPPKIPLLPNPGVAPPPARRLSLSPPARETTPVALEEETQPAYWAGLLGHIHSGPPPAGTHNNFAAPPPTIHPEPPGRPFNIPPPNYIAENTSNMPVEIQQGILNLLSNPQNLQQILTNLHSLGQPASASPSPVPAPPFSYSLNPIASAVDPSWAIASSAAQPHHLPRSLLTSPIPVPVAPKPVNYLEVKPPPPTTLFPTAWATTFLPSPPPQPLFSPFGTAGLIWPQPSTPIIASPQPNPLMTPIGQKRRLLPSPEPSPEGNYIGQHSQGIGGHYADSYFKRKKKN